jgi:hypothetical protein
MTDHKTETREEWLAAPLELLEAPLDLHQGDAPDQSRIRRHDCCPA